MSFLAARSGYPWQIFLSRPGGRKVCTVLAGGCGRLTAALARTSPGEMHAKPATEPSEDGASLIFPYADRTLPSASNGRTTIGVTRLAGLAFRRRRGAKVASRGRAGQFR